MTSKQLQKKIYAARKQAMSEIASSVDRTNMYSRGLAMEGYVGGYVQALDDVLAALQGGVS